MQIMICDDEKKEIEKMNKIVTEYAKEHPDFFIDLKYFSSPSDMLDEVEKNGAPDIALLDICMPGISGTQMAAELNKKSKNTTDIIFLTTSSDYAVEAYSLCASDYIKKPYDDKRLKEGLTRIIDRRRVRCYGLIQSGKDTFRIDLYSVTYAETKRGNVEIYLENGSSINTRIPLTKFKSMFENLEGFSMVGASYLVNFRYVLSINQDFIEITNGMKLPVPRRQRNELKLQFFEFYKKEAFEKWNI